LIAQLIFSDKARRFDWHARCGITALRGGQNGRVIEGISMRHEPLLRVLRAAEGYRRGSWRICGAVVLLGFFVGWFANFCHVVVRTAADEGLRCYAHLPVVSGDWNTMLAQCDGRPVAIGASPQRFDADTRLNFTANSAEYAYDMQAIRAVLVSAPPPIPKWALVAAALMALTFVAGLMFLFRGLWRAGFRLQEWLRAGYSMRTVAKSNADAMTPAVNQSVDLGVDLHWEQRWD
jgi:hypothetical protein